MRFVKNIKIPQRNSLENKKLKEALDTMLEKAVKDLDKDSKVGYSNSVRIDENKSENLLEENQPVTIKIENQAEPVPVVISSGEVPGLSNDQIESSAEKVVKPIESKCLEPQKEEEIKCLKGIISETNKYLRFMSIYKMAKMNDPADEAGDEMKILASTVNRFTGIILMLINLGFLIWLIIALANPTPPPVD